ncbi:MAG: hypothetical protein ACI9BH_003255, partial [Paracoccaceae bacterium]
VLSLADIAKLEAALSALRDAESAAQAEAHECTDLTARHDEAKETYNTAASKTPAKLGIDDILARHDVDHLAPAVANARHNIVTAETKERAAREELTTGAVQFGALPSCPTSLINAQEWSNRQTDLIQKIDQTEDALTQHAEDAAARRAQADQLISGRSLTPDAETDAYRVERDRLWDGHQKALTKETADLFGVAMLALDTAMQSRVSHASDLGQLRQIEQAHAESVTRADQAGNRLAVLRDKQTKLAFKVNLAATAIGMPVVPSAAEWLDWVQRHGAAVEASNKLAQLRDIHQSDLDRAEHLLEALIPHLNLENPDFEGALASARLLAETERKAIAATTKARDAFDTLKYDLDQRIKRQAAAQKMAKQATRTWCRLVSDFLGDAVAQQTLRASLDPLRRLREHENNRADAAQRVATMETDQAQFAESIATLAAAHDLPFADSATATFALLRERSEAAAVAEARAAELSAKVKKADANKTARQRQLDGINQKVDAMGRIFPESTLVDTLDALRSATSQAQQVIANRREKAKLERAVLSDLGAADMTTARQILDGTMTSTLDAEAETIKADLAAAEHHLTKATEARVNSGQALSQVTGDSDIAALTESKATLELELEDAALKHLELSLGHRLADEAIRRYRDTHRSGMMAATERCFSTLTQGAYVRLTTQPDGADEILLAVDGNGTAKRVAEMSKGTRFQLYLALRAAAHEQMVAQGNCLPFFCDDIFETFDEDRTSAACRVMEQIGQRGQAIYLTHHRHVVDIAMQVCDTAPTIHEI